jgi:hypothetical protein
MAKRSKKRKRKAARLPAPTYQNFRVIASRPLTEEKDEDGRNIFKDSLDVQISVRVKVPKGRKLSAKVIKQAVMFRAKHGRNPRGFRVLITRWRNPDRRRIADQKWRGQPGQRSGDSSQQERFETLGRALRGSRMVYAVSAGRTARRKARRAKIVSRLRPKTARKRRARVPRPKANRARRKVGAIRPHKKGVSRRSKAPKKAKPRRNRALPTGMRKR